MLIKQLYSLNNGLRALLELPDGSLYTFLLSPYRRLSDRDLSPVTSTLPPNMYKAYVHADPYDGAIEEAQMRFFGLTKNPLVEYRRAAGLTQAQLAAASGIHPMKISKIERGEIKLENISLSTSAALAKALGISPESFLV